MLLAAQGSQNPQSICALTLSAFDDLVSVLEEARPERLATERRDFRNARDWNDLLITRSELVIGAKLARPGVRFDFGVRGGLPEPDILLRDDCLAIEVKSRRLNGLDDLHAELETALREVQAPATVHIRCQERPLVIKPEVRKGIVERVIARVQERLAGSIPVTLEQPWSASQEMQFSVTLFMNPPLDPENRVFVDGGFQLANHLADIEAQITAVLVDDQKQKQAQFRPTILLVDVARTGLPWLRSNDVWARRLVGCLCEETFFIGVGMMLPTLTEADVPISLALREGLPPDDRAAALRLASSIGLKQI